MLGDPLASHDCGVVTLLIDEPCSGRTRRELVSDRRVKLRLYYSKYVVDAIIRLIGYWSIYTFLAL